MTRPALSWRRRFTLAAVGSALAFVEASGLADEKAQSFSDEEILGAPRAALRIESIATRITAFDQTGRGYQSQAGPLLGPGSERTTILEPQLEVEAAQGSRLKHRIIVPIDVVTAASADAIDKHRRPVDVISSASRQNFAGTFDWTATYRASPATDVAVRSGLHLEEPFRSWYGGMSVSRSFGDGDAVLSASMLEVFDWFDHFDIHGFRGGRTDRASTTATVGLTKFLTPTTITNLNYGLTVQEGELGNTWNVVPLATLALGPELLPTERLRHAMVGRVSQFLPWNGALHLYYRLYADDWGIVAQSVEGQLLQRLLPIAFVGVTYRFHHQTGASFFTTLASPDDRYRTADSDLAPLDAQTFGGKLVFDVPIDAEIKMLHLDIGFERYVRTNELGVNVVTCGTGYRF